MMRLLRNALWTWALFQGLAVGLGMLREWVLPGVLPPLATGLLTAQTEVVLVLLFTWLSQRRVRAELTRFRLVVIGLFWAGLAGLMEAAFPHFVLGRPWNLVLEPYATLQGKLHGVVLLVIMAAPLITGWRATQPSPGGGADSDDSGGGAPDAD